VVDKRRGERYNKHKGSVLRTHSLADAAGNGWPKLISYKKVTVTLTRGGYFPFMSMATRVAKAIAKDNAS
jgi:hypothetical protein